MARKPLISALPVRIKVAVFPMPNAVLFPGVALPLQFHDERYSRMLREAQGQGCSVAVALAATPKKGDEMVLNTICGAGPVQLLKSFPDGHSEAVLMGERRVKLLSITQKHPYLMMEAEDLPPVGTPLRPEVSLAVLKKLIQSWAFLHPAVSNRVGPIFDEFDSQAELTDFFVFHFVQKVELQQAYLNCTDVTARGEMLQTYLQERLQKLVSRTQREIRGSLIH